MSMSVFIFNETCKVGGLLFISMSIIHYYDHYVPASEGVCGHIVYGEYPVSIIIALCALTCERLDGL